MKKIERCKSQKVCGSHRRKLKVILGLGLGLRPGLRLGLWLDLGLNLW